MDYEGTRLSTLTVGDSPPKTTEVNISLETIAFVVWQGSLS